MRWFTGQRLADIAAQTARVEPADAAHIACRTDAETKMRLVRPVDPIVPAAKSGAGVVGDLVLLDAGGGETIESGRVHRQLQLLIERADFAALALLPELSSLFVGQPVRGDVRRIEGQRFRQ